MADTITIKAEKRDGKLNPRQLRKSGLLPATLYGKAIDSLSIQVNAKEFENEFKKNPDAKFNIALGSKTYNVELIGVQMNYSTAEQLNVEFKMV